MSSTEALRVAVVGAGSWGAQHTRAFSERPDTSVVAVVARRLSTASQRAASIGATPYDSIDEMMARERPDLVTVCLPNTAHVEPTRALLDHGVPLLVEKPLAFEVDEARALLALAERAGSFFAINFNHRYAEPIMRARAAIDQGRLGDLSFASWRFGGEGGVSSGPDGNLIETQCHGFDTLEHLAGPISAVSAEMTELPGRGHSTVALALRFANGAVGSLLGSYDSSYAYPGTHHLELNGNLGRVSVTDTVRRFELSSAGEETREVWEAGYFNDTARAFHRTFDRYLDALVPALRAGASPPVPASAGLRALELAHAAIRSFQTGTRMDTAQR